MVLDPQSLNIALRTLTPAQEKALRMEYGIGCERPHTLSEILQEFSEFQYSHRHTREVIRQANIAMRGLLGKGYKRELASLRRLRTLIYLPGPEEQAEVRLATQRLIDDARIEPAALLELSARQFEELIAEVWSRFGYVVELTARTKDGGRDVIAVRRAEAEVRYLIECKRYSPQHKVGVQFVRALYGVRTDERATKAFLATTSTFSRDALIFFERHRWELEARDFEGVRRWIFMARTHQLEQKSGLWFPNPENMHCSPRS